MKNGEVIEAYFNLLKHNNNEQIIGSFRKINNEKYSGRNGSIKIDKKSKCNNDNSKIRKQLLPTICHEFKTPLNIIMGALQLIDNIHTNIECPNIEGFNKNTKLMKQNCYRLLKLINNFIDLSRVETGFLDMNVKNVNIIEVVENITQSVVVMAKYKGINLVFDTDMEMKILACDPDKMERIILNLLSNAIKFTPKGGNIYVKVYVNDDRIKISVKDTGVGIPQDKLGDIFEIFNKLETNSNVNKQGSGIGLSLVQSLIEAHDGDITVNSKVGEGTEFIVSIPVKQTTDTYTTNRNNIDYPKTSNVERISIEFSDIYSFEY
ncbi:sensor histidine kinase [Dethiothermospora halolimnae]|uniref:sensor histidine kinase n=1 Tax=Dethiothermospora halolimnae TaxID=3114390 RepID=UPI003CCC4618